MASGAGPAQWTVLEYTTDRGETPVRMFLEELTGRNREEAFALLAHLRERGNALREPTSKALGGGLFELRGHQVRIFYMFRPRFRIVLLDGMIKKEDRIPGAVLTRVRRYQREVERLAEEAEGG